MPEPTSGAAGVHAPRRVAVFGATGVLGRHVVAQLLERGHAVRAVVRAESPVPPAWQGAPRLHLVTADLLQPATLPAALQGCEVVLNLATAVPRPGQRADWSRNDRVRREGTRALLQAAHDVSQAPAGAAAARPLRIVQQSVAMLQAGPPERLADESDPVHGPGVLASAVDMEALVRASGLPWALLRGGLFYGPGTGFGSETNRLARAGVLRLPGDGSHFVSLVRPEDMAAAVVRATEADLQAETIAIVDDEPVRWRDLLAHVAALHGAAEPAPGAPAAMAGFRVGNVKARALLGWRPVYADYRSGWTLD
ncbi:MAG: NAD(P)-dependent oxidoreductase [Rubrivivax sp.]|nr:NAD(P)-dependent oxidoreductase [Rubrivivax sp.]